MIKYKIKSSIYIKQLSPILMLKHNILNQHFCYRNVTILINAKNRHSLCGGMLSFLESRLLLFSWASFCKVKNIKDKTH